MKPDQKQEGLNTQIKVEVEAEKKQKRH